MTKKFKKMLMTYGVSRNRAGEFADYIAKMSQYSTEYKLTAETCRAVAELDRTERGVPAFALF